MQNDKNSSTQLASTSPASSRAAPVRGLVSVPKVLSEVISTRIIPRLLQSHQPTAALRPADKKVALSRRDIAEFATLVLSDNSPEIDTFVALCRARGMTIEAIYLRLLTDTARYIGTLWANDDCDFCEVTLALWRIQRLLHDLSPAFHAERHGASPHSGHRVLLAPIAGEQHMLGPIMVAEFFRRAGWEVSGELPTANDQLVEIVRDQWLDMVGISVGGLATTGDLKATIRAIRRASINPSVGVMVGGWMFIERPELVMDVGADFAAADARDAVVMATACVARYSAVANRGSAGMVGQHAD